MNPHLQPEDIAVYVYDEASAMQRANRLRAAAAHYAASRGLPPDGDFTVEKQPRGKPFFPARPELHFSISHSGAYWLVAFHSAELGLDIQQHTPRACAALAKRWYHGDEFSAVLQYGEACFFPIWSAKESLCKANGQGINESFSQFCVAKPDGTLLSSCNGWQLRPFELAKGYSASLCAQKIGQVHIINAEYLTQVSENIMDYAQESLRLHYELRGKLEITARAQVSNREQLALAYTPGVAQPCLEIQKDAAKSYELTRRWNTVAVITDGSAVLGLGDIGPEAAMPVMEGKCVLFKTFADIDALPLCLRTQNVDEIVRTVQLLAGSFGGVNLEDIAAPRCFEIERRLKQVCDIPIFHDDQHGTAVVALAALINALKLTGRDKAGIRVAMSGGGAAACAVARLLLSYGVTDISLCDIEGVIYSGRPGLNPDLAELAAKTNKRGLQGSLADIVAGADVFIGLSAPKLLTGSMVQTMAAKPIVFAMANPNPEIMPQEALAAGAAIVGTGRSDFANQINNVLAFPGIFRGALDARAQDINEPMKLAAAYALAELATKQGLTHESILPPGFDPAVAPAVAAAVAQAARTSGVARTD